MKKFLFSLSISLLISGILIGRYFSDFYAFKTGGRLLLPVRIEDVKTDAFSSRARVRYYNFIPVDELLKEKGTVVISRSDDGRAEFVSKAAGQRLRPRELLLKYTIMPPSLLKRETTEPNIRFATSELRFASDQKLQVSAVCYAVVYVNGNGDAFLAGLADCSGAQLTKGLIFPIDRTL